MNADASADAARSAKITEAPLPKKKKQKKQPTHREKN